MKFLTESGSIYEIDGDHIRRINTEARKRADGEWIRLLEEPVVWEGYPVRLVMESLSSHGPDDYGNRDSVEPMTIRTSTPVERIWGE